MRIDCIEMHHLVLPYVSPFEPSFGRETKREFIVLSITSDGVTGWGECVAGSGPWYSYETVGTAWNVLEKHLIPSVLFEKIDKVEDIVKRFDRVRGHPMARACVENALWDLLGRSKGLSLAEMLSAKRDSVSVGVSVGIEKNIGLLLAKIEQHIDEGYGRVKLKIKPGWDVDVVKAVREKWPDLALQVDANSAYSLADTNIFLDLDQFDLLLIEQPLHHDDIVNHAELQKQLITPVCLDESIHSVEHARWALGINACRIINIKVGRVGGITAASQIHDLCAERGIPVWCGGMLESNIGRAVNVALAALPNFKLPGDISASDRYYHKDIALPNFVLNSDSTLDVPNDIGMGVVVDQERLAHARISSKLFS